MNLTEPFLLEVFDGHHRLVHSETYAILYTAERRQEAWQRLGYTAVLRQEV